MKAALTIFFFFPVLFFPQKNKNTANLDVCTKKTDSLKSALSKLQKENKDLTLKLSQYLDAQNTEKLRQFTESKSPDIYMEGFIQIDKISEQYKAHYDYISKIHEIYILNKSLDLYLKDIEKVRALTKEINNEVFFKNKMSPEQRKERVGILSDSFDNLDAFDELSKDMEFQNLSVQNKLGLEKKYTKPIQILMLQKEPKNSKVK